MGGNAFRLINESMVVVDQGDLGILGISLLLKTTVGYELCV